MNRYDGFPLRVAVLIAAAPAHVASAAPAAKETVVLQRVPVVGTDRQLAMGIAQFPPFGEKPRHEATGPELCYVLQGEVTVSIDGEQDKTYRTGETFQLPAGVVHVTRAGAAGARVLASWVWVPDRPFNLAPPTN